MCVPGRISIRGPTLWACISQRSIDAPIDDRREVLLHVRQTVGVCMCADFFLASCDPPPILFFFFFFFPGSERRTCSSSASIRHRHRPSTRWLHPCLLWRGLVYSCVPALYQGSKDSGYRSRGAANSLRTTVWFEGSRANPTPSKNTCTWGGVAIIAVGESTVSGLWVPVVRCRGVRRKRTRFVCCIDCQQLSPACLQAICYVCVHADYHHRHPFDDPLSFSLALTSATAQKGWIAAAR